MVLNAVLGEPEELDVMKSLLYHLGLFFFVEDRLLDEHFQFFLEVLFVQPPEAVALLVESVEHLLLGLLAALVPCNHLVVVRSVLVLVLARKDRHLLE